MGCTCSRSQPPCDGVRKGATVFSGTVLSSRPGPSGRVADFMVVESFVGSIPKTVTVRTGFGGGDCGFDFKVGKTYLVYAGSSQDGGLGTGICSRTREVGEGKEDIEILRELKVGGITKKSRLFGNANWLSKSGDYGVSSSPLADARIVANDSHGRTVETRTDANGNYVFRGLRAGQYGLRLFYGANFEKAKGVQIGTTTKDRCVEQDFFAWVGPRVTGKVIDDKGNPVVGIRVIAAYYRNPDDEDSWSWFDGRSDQSGRFEVEGLTPGTYTVGVNFDGPTKKEFPFPPAFHPNVKDAKLAKRISIDEQKSYDGFDITVGTGLIPRTVSGIVVFPDGSPARGAMVEVKEERTTWRMDIADVAKDGRFTLSAFEGVSYYFYVYKDSASWRVNKETKKVFIPKTGVLEPLKIVVPKPQK